jgi:hypothetical protein
MNMPDAGWQYSQLGTVFAEFNHQGGDRGGDQFVAPNWWMGMAGRKTAHGDIALTGMLSLDAATVGRTGYRELFQTGEMLDGKPIVDWQHPHDLFMQLSASWRIPLGAHTGLTLTGAPVGEPALGPVAFMHRASAGDNPAAPLGHHSFDSTHISDGVVTASVDRGPWTIEGSVFNGREPDDQRWDLDFGPLDSVAGRVWFKPTAEWAFQLSTGRLTRPEALEPGNILRTTASASWTRSQNAREAAVTVALGRNDTDHGARSALLVEGSIRRGRHAAYTRFEMLQVEAGLVEETWAPAVPIGDGRDRVFAWTAGGVRDLLRSPNLDAGIGADVTFYEMPDRLTASYGARPVSFHVFFRLRHRSGTMGDMRTNGTMSH